LTPPDERRLLSVLENALEVCEYTDVVDVTFSHTRKSKQSRILDSLVDLLSIACGLLMSNNLTKVSLSLYVYSPSFSSPSPFISSSSTAYVQQPHQGMTNPFQSRLSFCAAALLPYLHSPSTIAISRPTT
jgi:hypothetical protein